MVPGLYCEVDGSSESNQVDFCLVKDGNLFTIFGEKRVKEKGTKGSVRNRLREDSACL